jgi:tetratricopeptide (TPR) repeat protein
MADQPSAPEPPAALARWLAHLAERDPQFADQAQDAFDRALTLSPNDIQTLNDQALFWASQGRTDEAIAELNRLLALDPLYGPTYRNLARVYQQMGDEDAARAIIEQGRAHVPWWDGLQ